MIPATLIKVDSSISPKIIDDLIALHDLNGEVAMSVTPEHYILTDDIPGHNILASSITQLNISGNALLFERCNYTDCIFRAWPLSPKFDHRIITDPPDYSKFDFTDLLDSYNILSNLEGVADHYDVVSPELEKEVRKVSQTLQNMYDDCHLTKGEDDATTDEA